MFLKRQINWWFLGFIGISTISLWFAHTASVKYHIRETTITVTAKMNKEYQIKLDKAVSDAIATTKRLQDEDNKLKAGKYAKLENNNSRLTADIIRLRNRPERPATPNTPQPPQSGSACTAVQLYKEDAEFLTREAARAESVLIERDNYYERYIAAKRELEHLATQPK